MKKLVSMLIRCYQIIISPLFFTLGARCRFYPSCSEYARRAFINLPWTKAVEASFRRLLRCGPWHPGGVDL